VGVLLCFERGDLILQSSIRKGVRNTWSEE
jgi:hypothetical protein